MSLWKRCWSSADAKSEEEAHQAVGPVVSWPHDSQTHTTVRAAAGGYRDDKKKISEKKKKNDRTALECHGLGFAPDNCLPYMVPVVNKEEVSPLDGTAVFSGRLQEAAQSSRVSFGEVVRVRIFISAAAIKTTNPAHAGNARPSSQRV